MKKYCHCLNVQYVLHLQMDMGVEEKLMDMMRLSDGLDTEEKLCNHYADSVEPNMQNYKERKSKDNKNKSRVLTKSN